MKTAAPAKGGGGVDTEGGAESALPSASASAVSSSHGIKTVGGGETAGGGEGAGGTEGALPLASASAGTSGDVCCRLAMDSPGHARPRRGGGTTPLGHSEHSDDLVVV